MSFLIERFQNYYAWMEEKSDPRTADMFLISSPLPTYLSSLAYVIISWKIGPLLMKNKAPFQLQYPLVIYNLMVMYLNFHIFKELLFGAIEAGYSFPCQDYPTTTTSGDMRIARAIWWYFFSKLLEFTDTLFFILRKKNEQISFLHVYHHFSMPMIWWIGAKWAPAGLSASAAMLNSLTHILTYFYYGLAAMGPSVKKYLWWKKYVTQTQLVQFFIALFIAALNLYNGCVFPEWMTIALLLYVSSLVVLFGNFYIRAYLTKKQTTTSEMQKVKIVEHVNGIVEVDGSSRSSSRTYELRSRVKNKQS